MINTLSTKLGFQIPEPIDDLEKSLSKELGMRAFDMRAYRRQRCVKESNKANDLGTFP